jgi:hypothetical protein
MTDRYSEHLWMSGLARKQIISGGSQQRLLAERPPPRAPTPYEREQMRIGVNTQALVYYNGVVGMMPHHSMVYGNEPNRARVWPPVGDVNDSDDEVEH